METKARYMGTVMLILAAGLVLGADANSPAAKEKVVPAAGMWPAGDPNAAAILAKVKATYKDMKSFTATGQVVTKTVTMDPNTCVMSTMVMKTDFTMKLARPSLYLIEWSQRGRWEDPAERPTSAVYSDGSGDFLVTDGTKTPQQDRKMALAAATGISAGASATIPAMFFGEPLGNIEGVGMTKKFDDWVEGEHCYVLACTMMPRGSETRVWIAKDTYLVKCYETIITAMPGIDEEPNDEKVREQLRQFRIPTSDHEVANYKESFQRSRAMNAKGTVKTSQTFDERKVDQLIKESEFVPVKVLESVKK